MIDAFRNVNNSLLLGPACFHMNQMCSEFAVNSFDLTFCFKIVKVDRVVFQSVIDIEVHINSEFVKSFFLIDTLWMRARVP